MVWMSGTTASCCQACMDPERPIPHIYISQHCVKCRSCWKTRSLTFPESKQCVKGVKFKGSQISVSTLGLLTTSSRINKAPYLSQMARMAWKYPSTAGTHPSA